MRAFLAAVTIVVAACSSSSTPTAPSPSPAPAPTRIAITGTITSTVTGQPVGTFAQDVDSLPAQVTVSLSGFVTRQTWVRSASPTVDLFPETGFDLGFYRQFARNGLESPGSLSTLRVLSQAPAIYLQTAGLTSSTVASFESVARSVVPALTGGRFSLGEWSTGDAAMTPRVGWVVTSLVNDDNETCGRATIGASAGEIWLNTAPKCHRGGAIVGTPHLFAHELGHALGFWHVPSPGWLMSAVSTVDAPSATERHHAALAYARQAGNTDVDVDPLTPSQFSTRIVVD